MPKWVYGEVHYSPSSRTWVEIGGSGQSGRVDRSWLSEICNAMAQQGWEYVTSVLEINDYRLLFKKPG